MAAKARERDGGDGIVRGRIGDALLQAGGQVAALRIGEKILAPVVDQGHLAQVAAGRESRLDRLASEIRVARDLVVERVCEARARAWALCPRPGLRTAAIAWRCARVPVSAGAAAADAATAAGCSVETVTGSSAEPVRSRRPHSRSRAASAEIRDIFHDCVIATQVLPTGPQRAGGFRTKYD